MSSKFSYINQISNGSFQQSCNRPRGGIYDSLTKAQQLLDGEFYVESIRSAWSACELLISFMNRSYGITSATQPSSFDIMKEKRFQDTLNRMFGAFGGKQVLDTLHNIRKYRNNATHSSDHRGQEATILDQDLPEVSKWVFGAATEVVEKLLKGMGLVGCTAGDNIQVVPGSTGTATQPKPAPAKPKPTPVKPAAPKPSPAKPKPAPVKPKSTPAKPTPTRSTPVPATPKKTTTPTPAPAKPKPTPKPTASAAKTAPAKSTGSRPAVSSVSRKKKRLSASEKKDRKILLLAVLAGNILSFLLLLLLKNRKALDISLLITTAVVSALYWEQSSIGPSPLDHQYENLRDTISMVTVLIPSACVLCGIFRFVRSMPFIAYVTLPLTNVLMILELLFENLSMSDREVKRQNTACILAGVIVSVLWLALCIGRL